MSVTQDYKILTLTQAEHDAVRRALGRAEVELESYVHVERNEDVKKSVSLMLAAVQTALAKVRA